MPIAYFDCYSGISGDMTLGALIDAGVPFGALRAFLETLPVRGYEITASPHESKGVTGTRVDVALRDEQPHRHLKDVLTILSSIEERAVRERAAAVFHVLATAEAEVHGTGIDEVHFHEVGAIDAIVDVVGAVWCLRYLGIESVFVSPLPSGSGRVRSAHGVLPVPAPGTLEILRRTEATIVPNPAEGEMVTPTGAALIATFGTFRQPAMRVQTIGYGFGRKEFPWPNALRVWIGEAVNSAASREPVSVLETNVDDDTPERLGALMDNLLGDGALDVYLSPIHMKKNRLATRVSVICRVDDESRLARRMIHDTTTLGVRAQRMERYVASRRSAEVETPWGQVRVKVKYFGGVASASPEYDDCVALSRTSGVSLSLIFAAAIAAATPLTESTDPVLP
ncbi:MAG: nickel pincer cofactor biosynthesis protein LarC [Chloroflexi bacterium]|nr:nickel pincer cofactor biosynthesis protein LarC [Chloroflexota bacterium]